MKFLVKIVLTLSCLAVSMGTSAIELSFWATDGWSKLTADSEDDLRDTQNGYQVHPGYGGQAFDAEGLYYKLSGDILHLGMQTGFDIIDGHQEYSNQQYYAGDLALSFGNGVILGDATTYEYGIDFGLYTKDYRSRNDAVGDSDYRVNILAGDTDGEDAAGLYNATSWNNHVVGSFAAESSPFAIDGGSFYGSLLSSESGTHNYLPGFDSHWRTVSFNASGLDLSQVDVHWTMSCGNDNMNGGFSVPESSLLSLMGLGLIGLGFIRRRKAKA